MSKQAINFYLDTLLVETVLGNSNIKIAQSGGMLSGLGEMVKNYVGQHIDENDKVGSVINMLAPGAITTIFRGLGMTRVGLLFGLVASVLHIDVASMLENLWKSVKSTLEQGGKVSQDQITNVVNQNIQQQSAPLSQQDAEQIGQKADQGQADFPFDKREFNKELRDARILRLALEQYEKNLFKLTKEGAGTSWFSNVNSKKTQTTSLLARILGWVFTVVLTSAGLMVAGDVVNKTLGRPSALGNTPAAGPATTQSKFPLNPSYSDSAQPHPWVENVPNNESSIQNMLLQFTKDVYSGLDGKEEMIESSPTFQAVRDQIVWYNHTAAGEPQVYIPTMYTTKKSIVDHYIDEVAKNA